MFGLTLILILIGMGGAIAFFGDRIGTRVGKRRMTLWGLRPRYTSIIVTIITGILIAGSTLGILTFASYDVRTALFGMDALKKQTQNLANEVALRNQELDKAHRELSDKNREYADTNQKIKAIGEQLKALLTEKQGLDQRIANLNAERAVLQKDIDRLNEMTANLRKGIDVIREGTIVVRAGEVLSIASMRGGQAQEELQRQVQEHLNAANQRLLERFGVKDKNVVALYVPDAHVKELLVFLTARVGENIGLRLLSVGNVVGGEPVVGQFEVFANQLVYIRGAVVLADITGYSGNAQEAEAVMNIFLRRVNEMAVQQGILRDPLQGTVGALPVQKYYEAVNQLRRLSGRVEISAVAVQDIYSAGPLLIEIMVKPAL